MSWQDRAVPADSSQSGGWMDRATSVDQSASTPQGSSNFDVAKSIAKELLPSANPGLTMLGGMLSSSPQQPSSPPIQSPTPSPAPASPEFQQDKSYPPEATDPTGQRLLKNAAIAAGGYQVVNLAASAVAGVGSKVASFFNGPPDLLNAGIKPSTLEHMTPPGVNPADYAKTLRQQLLDGDAIAKTPEESVPKMEAYINEHGKGVAADLNTIKQAKGPDAVTVDAQKVLQPIYDAWAKEVNATDPNPQVISKLSKYYSRLADTAGDQGGRLTLDNLHDTLQEAGPKTQSGSDAMKSAYKTVYKSLADSRDLAAQTVADQSGNPQLAQSLLAHNKGYSTGMRLIHDIRMGAAQSAIKPGVSTAKVFGEYAKTALGVGGGVYAGVQTLRGLLRPNQ